MVIWQIRSNISQPIALKFRLGILSKILQSYRLLLSSFPLGYLTCQPVSLMGSNYDASHLAAHDLIGSMTQLD